MKLLSKIILALGLLVFMYHYNSTANGDCITKRNEPCYCPCGAKPTPNDYTYKIYTDYRNKCNKCEHIRMPQQPIQVISATIKHDDQQENNDTQTKKTQLLKKIAHQMVH